MDHSQLIADLPKIEKLTAAERLKIARDRRAVQLRIFDQYDREFSSKSNKHLANQRVKHARGKNRNIRFVHSVMLLEAAARNDIDEGEPDARLSLLSSSPFYLVLNPRRPETELSSFFFGGGGAFFWRFMARTEYFAIGLDWKVTINVAITVAQF